MLDLISNAYFSGNTIINYLVSESVVHKRWFIEIIREIVQEFDTQKII